jgi:F0F1-type ATP synthase assembly protein I
MPDSPHPAEQFRSLGVIYQLVGEFLAPILVGLAVDWLAKTGPWGTVCGVLIGAGVAGWHVVRLSQRIGNRPGGSGAGSKPQGGSP